MPPTDPSPGGLSVGIGLGGGTSSSRGDVSFGTGVGIGPGPFRATTLAVFRRDEVGGPPWRLRVKVVGVERVDIVIDLTGSREPAGASRAHPEEAAWTPSA